MPHHYYEYLCHRNVIIVFINVYKCIILLGILQGGMKSVLWVDTLQTLAILAALAALIFKGLFISGGIQSMWQAAEKGHRQNLLRY